MPARFDDDRLLLSGVVTIEEAEQIRDLLACHPRAGLDLAACEHLHTAALQVLLSARRAVVRRPEDAFLTAWILPELLARGVAIPPSVTGEQAS
jgi:hypothetical protein